MVVIVLLLFKLILIDRFFLYYFVKNLVIGFYVWENLGVDKINGNLLLLGW